MYSLCPKVRNENLRLRMYAGATIMDTPKSALAVIATDSAISTSANKYAASLGIRIFFIAVIVIPPGLSFFPSAKIANDGIIQ